MKLYLDIETLPAEDSKLADIKFLYSRKVEKLAKKKDVGEDTITSDDANGNSFDKFFKNTCFDGSFGRILCIAYAINNEPTEVICFKDDEKKLLQVFWEIAREATLFVGHNVMDFDLRFIYQRSIILGVRPSRNLSFARYRCEPIYDTMREWTKWAGTGTVGLEHLAIALGLPTPKDGIDGSQVYEFYQAGKINEICEYCKRDVETTRSVYKRMVFEA